MDLKDDRWFYCELCETVAYKLSCCDNSTCNGMGCVVCDNETLRNEISKRIKAGEYPFPLARVSRKEW